MFLIHFRSKTLYGYRAFFSLTLQEFKSERYRLKLIVDELGLKENPLDYKTTLLAFINCLVIATPQLKDRVRIRNEFIGEYIYFRTRTIFIATADLFLYTNKSAHFVFRSKIIGRSR